MKTSARPSPCDRPQGDRRLPGQGAVHGHLSGRPLCRHRLLRQGVDGLLSLLHRRRQGGTRQGRTEGYGRRRHRELPGRYRRRQGRRGDAARQRRLPDRQEPRRRRGGVDGADRHPRHRQRGHRHQHDLDPEQRQVGLAGVPQRLRADLGRAEHRRAGADRPADQPVPPRRQGRHRRPAALRAAARRCCQQVHLDAGQGRAIAS